MKTSEQKIAELEAALQRLTQQVIDLNKRVAFLEREGRRVKQDINQLGRK